MSQSKGVAKMFSVLVLGASTVLHASEPPPPSEAAPPETGDQPTSLPTHTRPSPEADQPATMPAAQKNEHCQLEFTFNRYDRERVQSITTCLDGKNDEEIMKLINDAKKQTCSSPFCGCWLG